MEKRKYQKEKLQIELSLQKLRNKIRMLEEIYIAQNRKFKDEQKVEIIDDDRDKKHIGYIDKAFIDYRNNIAYKFSKCKKDGTQSKRELWIWKVKEIKALDI